MAVRKQNASEQIFKFIEEKIYNKEWTPGMKISSENQLTAEFGVSRMSVREAIEKLVALNLLTKKQGEGTFVNELSPGIYLNKLIPMMMINPDNLLDVLEFRKAIEPYSARLCAERCDDQTIESIKECLRIMTVENNTSTEFAEADYLFHMEIAKGTKNSLIIKVNSVLTDLWQYQQKELNRYLGPAMGVKEHKDIVKAIENRDGELAELYMKRHVSRTYNDIRKIMDESTSTI